MARLSCQVPDKSVVLFCPQSTGVRPTKKIPIQRFFNRISAHLSGLKIYTNSRLTPGRETGKVPWPKSTSEVCSFAGTQQNPIRTGTKNKPVVSQKQDMFILSVPWDFRCLWAILTLTAKLYVLCLLAGAGYATYSLARIGLSLRAIRRHLWLSDKDATSAQLRNAAAKLETLRQGQMTLFLLFGVCSANEVFGTLRTSQHSAMSLSAVRIDALFEPLTAFAFVVSAVLLFLHLSQWMIAHRLQQMVASFRRRLTSPD